MVTVYKKKVIPSEPWLQTPYRTRTPLACMHVCGRLQPKTHTYTATTGHRLSAQARTQLHIHTAKHTHQGIESMDMVMISMVETCMYSGIVQPDDQNQNASRSQERLKVAVKTKDAMSGTETSSDQNTMLGCRVARKWRYESREAGSW